MLGIDDWISAGYTCIGNAILAKKFAADTGEPLFQIRVDCGGGKALPFGNFTDSYGVSFQIQPHVDDKLCTVQAVENFLTKVWIRLNRERFQQTSERRRVDTPIQLDLTTD